MKNLPEDGRYCRPIEAAAYLIGFALWIGVLNYSSEISNLLSR